jgi:hypothetical protein
MPTITFAHLDAMMRIVREPAPPAEPESEPGVAEVAGDDREGAQPVAAREDRGVASASRAETRFEKN